MADPDPAADWWTADEVAAYLGVKRSTVHAYRTRDQMPGPDQQYGKTPLWHPATIITWHATRSPRSRSAPDSTWYRP